MRIQRKARAGRRTARGARGSLADTKTSNERQGWLKGMDARPILLSLLLATASAADPPRPLRPSYVNTGGFVVGFQCAADTSVDQVRMWLSRDGGRSWSPASVERAGPQAVRCTVTSDGVYDCYLVLENAAGRSAPPPEPGSAPHARFIVDTQPPTVQVHEAQCRRTGVDGRTLRLRISVIEENLAEDAVRMYYRVRSDGSWQDGGVVHLVDGFLSWPVPAHVGDRVDLRLSVVDRAGNRCDDELPAVECSAPGGAVRAATSLPARTASRPVDDGWSAARTPLPARVDPPAPPEGGTGLPGRAESLRRQAATYVAEGRLALAAARLHDALELEPARPELMTELGDVLLKLRRTEEAEQRFREALRIDEGHWRAREGLALAALGQRRYADAREELRMWAAGMPNAPQAWLRLGDVEYKLGETHAALAAWQRAAESAGEDGDLAGRARQRIQTFGPSAEHARP